MVSQSYAKNFVPSFETLHHLKNKGFQALSIWGRGVDCTLFHPSYNTDLFRKKYNITAKYVLSYVGRLAPEKDIDTLQHLIAKTAHTRNDIHWLIIGDGPLAINLREAVPNTNVTFTGYLQGKDLAEAYACSNIMVFPSATETFGNVVLESLACGTPVIGANSGGVKNIITDGQTGVLCPPKHADSFLSSIHSLLRNEEQLMQMSIAASSYAKTKSWDEIFRGLLAQYETVLQNTASELLA